MAVQEIDFSCKHDRWILNADGSLSPMDEPYHRAVPVAPGTWQIDSSGDYAYLVAGERRAIAIDTGYGAGNIRAFMQSLTDKPLQDVINTHDHFDHTANNGYFDHAYMAAATVPLATKPFPSFAGISFPQSYPRVVVEPGFVFDLGGRTLEVFSLPDHAAGSILLLDRQQRLLFSGDEFSGPVKRLNGSVARFAAGLEELLRHRGDFDRLCGGPGIFDAALLDGFAACARRILAVEEGLPAPAPAPLPLPASPDALGRIVYDRHLPHPEDLHRDAEKGAADFRRCLRLDGVALEYDLRRITE